MASSPAANELPTTLHEGDVALGLLDTTYSPTVMEFCGELGLDFVWLDLEHGGPGERGLAAPRASRWGLAEDYVEREDEQTLVGATIETTTSVDAIEEILDVPDLGFVFIGPFDLSVSLGHPGELDHPEVEDAVETVRASAVDTGVPVGGLGFGMDDVNEKASNGYQMLHLGSTTGALQEAISGWLDAFEGERST